MNITKLNIEALRGEFDILHQKVNGQPLVYLDNAATTQKPKAVIEAVSAYYKTINSNVHRGVHTLSQHATDAFENARKAVQLHINAAQPYEVVFTRGTTESINLVAHGFRHFLKTGDEVVISHLEHHSNIVPWQMLCGATGAKLRVIPITDKGELDMAAYAGLLNENTRLVAVNHVSNALGTINPVKEIIEMAHAAGAAVLIDGAQSVPHIPIDVRVLDADFYAFSAHKVYGPTGFGVLYGKEEWLEKLPPYQGGGEMIATVTFEKTTYAGLPHKFEAGTPDISGAIGLAAALRWLNSWGWDAITARENELMQYGLEKLFQIEGLRFVGEAEKRAGAISFVIEGTHPYDVGVLLDKMGIAVRTGHHCTQPIMDRFGLPGTIRASFALYNTFDEIDALTKGLERARSMLV